MGYLKILKISVLKVFKKGPIYLKFYFTFVLLQEKIFSDSEISDIL